MSIQSLLNELNAVGGRLRRWEAEWRALTGTAAALALLWAFTLSDLFLRYGRAGRVLLWAALLAAVGAAFVAVGRVLRRGFTPEAVAARVEQAFPQLDNHLINTVQFAGRGGADKMVAAYLEREMPDWSTVAVTQLKDRKAQRRALALLAAAGVALLASALWSGPAWNNALLRIVNPFSQRPPVTLARILEVTPGDSSALAGSAVTLAARIDGKSGQKVFLDLWPADDRKSVVELGRLRGAAEQRFTYNLPKLSTDARYRIRAGDAVSDSYKLKAVTPPSFRKIAVRVSPPAYTGLKPRNYNGLSDTAVVPQGATVEFDLEGDRPLAMATVTVTNHTAEISAAPAATRRGGKLEMLTGDAVAFAITDKAGYSAEAQLRAEFRPDAPPAIKIITPTSRTLLGLGARPRIQWEATDEYGLAEVRLEQITDSEKGTGVTVRAWALKGEGTFAQIWTADDPPAIEAGQPLVYRIVALDNGTVGGVRSTRSSPIVFDTVSTAAARKNEEKRVSETADTLSRLTELQRTNLEKTTKLAPVATNATAEAWNGLRVTQEEIARIASGLLAAPGKPLGALTMVLRDLQEGPMKQVVGVLARAPAAAPAERPALCTQGIALETRILKSLTAVENGAARVAQHRQVTGLLALLDALVAGQEDTLAGTRTALSNKVATVKNLADRQDKLAGDVPEFVGACRKEAEAVARNDAEFAKLVTAVAADCEAKKVAATMLTAAEHLSNSAADKALPLEATALAQLKEFQAALNKWRAADATAKAQQLEQVLEQDKEKMEKLKALQAKVVDAIRQTEQQKDKSQKPTEELAQDLADLKGNMAEVLLKIATDLQVFPELPVGNDLVSDVNQIYEEVKQVEGSEAAKATELGLQKEDWILAELAKATDRLDDMEMWLVSAPDAVKRNTEAFDKTELPQIPVIPMASEVEDIIGDLLEQEKKEEEKSDDSAGNQGTADIAAGWGIAEGEFTSYAAKGKSGNERPDHKEQDGRSLVGRQGQSDGETTAGSGKVNEGDKNIEARRTQDSAQSGEVQEEGHSESKATGGGKLSGFGDRLGMAGNGPRRDANTTQGSELGMQAMLRRNAESLYAKASLAHLRTGSMDEVARHMRSAEEALAKGYPIREVREYQRRAILALKRTQAELDPGVSIDAGGETPRAGPPVDDQVAGAPDEAPAQYRDLVSDYFKSLNEVQP